MDVQQTPTCLTNIMDFMDFQPAFPAFYQEVQAARTPASNGTPFRQCRSVAGDGDVCCCALPPVPTGAAPALSTRDDKIQRVMNIYRACVDHSSRFI